MPSSAKYSTLAAGIPFAIERLEYSPSIFAISRASAALDLIRRDNRRARREVEVFGEAERTVQPQFEQLDDSQRQLVAALDHLPRDQREVLVMKIWNELTFAEIAEALGISQNTAASRYRYGLAALKKTFQPQ